MTGAVVLCGGRSSRMGRDKASLPFHGDTLLGRTVRTVARSAEDVVVVARPGQDLPPLPEGVRVVRDERPDQGPLGGLGPGLRASRSDVCFVTSCDTPFLVPAVIDLLRLRLRGADVAVAETDDGAERHVHPLCSVVRRSVAPRIDALLDAGRRRPVFLYDEVATVRVGETELRAVDPELRSFVNCNDPGAYAAALDAPPPPVRVEFFDVARIRAGVASADVTGATLGEALAAAARALPGLVPGIVRDGALAPQVRASLGGERFVEDPLTPLVPGDAVLLLSAQAGG